MARSRPSALYVGLMSGTSMDGADALVARCGRQVPEVLGMHSAPYPETLRGALLALQHDADARLDDALTLHAQLGEWYAETVLALLERTGFRAREIHAIGCHGQTVRHLPSAPLPQTLQVGDLARVATRTGITTVGDFRRMDMAAGGQGAPLAPLMHQVLFAHGAPASVINLGGIANLSVLGHGGKIAGFDTGPGNALLDGWAQRCSGARFDSAGAFAARGTVCPVLLDALLAHPYFLRRPPKSTGRDEFSPAWVDAVLASLDQPTPSVADVQATLAELTARTVTSAIQAYAPDARRVVLCGGGVYNVDLVRRITAALPRRDVMPSDDLGIPATAVEALMMAWLAAARMRGRRVDTSAVTGARGPVRLGCVYRP